MDKLIINVALTGHTSHKADSPALPITPEEVAADARRCADLGATIFHVHARNKHGSPTWGAGVYRSYVDVVRAAVPGAVVCVSTSGRNGLSYDERAESLLAKPDMGSLTLGSVDFEGGTEVNERRTVRALARRMRDLGIVPECEAFDLGHIYRMPTEFLPERFWLNFILGPCLPYSIVAMEIAAHESLWSVFALGAMGSLQWSANRTAISNGWHVRTGLGDNLKLDYNVPATNMSLVERVVQYARSVEREPATIEETRGALGLG